MIATKRKFKYPFFVSPHAVNRFRERVANIPPAEVIEYVQEVMQNPGLPITVEYRDSQLSPIYRASYRGKTFYVPIIKGGGEWPAVPTIVSETETIHWKFQKGKLDYIYKKEEKNFG